MLRLKASLRNAEDDESTPEGPPNKEQSQLSSPDAAFKEPSVVMEVGKNNDVSICFSQNNRGKPTRLIFNGIFEKKLLRTVFVPDSIKTIVLLDICRSETCVLERSEFPQLEHVTFDGGNCRAQIPRTVSKITYQRNYEIEKNLSLPSHVTELAITTKLCQTLRSISCGGVVRISVDGQDIAADGHIRFGAEFKGIKSIDLSGSSFREVSINNLPELEHLFLSNSAVSLLTIGSESRNNLKNVSLIGCNYFQPSTIETCFQNIPRLIVAYDDRTAGNEVFSCGNNLQTQCHFVKIRSNI
ncbi:MAG: hypothetical protein LBD72_02620 [Puniceicoccales bacterium]|jgi:hypothetical protein|nr:hypothetical protein [Puniceicoccales bacterium]